MSFLDEDEPSPWGAPQSFDAEPSPWGNHSDHEPEEPELEDVPDQDDPYTAQSAHIDSSQLLGASTPAQGLEFVPTSTPTPEDHAAVSRKSPARRARSSKKIKNAVAETQSIDAGPLSFQPESPEKSAKKNELENISLEEPRDASLDSRSAPRLSLLDDDDEEEESEQDKAAHSRMTIPELPGKLDIHVGDPIKVGDITSAHIIYTINTTTDLPQFPENDGIFSVTRRYRDFRWLYKALVSNNPGCIVPPPSDKQVFGTLNEDFIESRRAALETMLVKVAHHPTLRNDPDLMAFLVNPDFNEYLKTRVISDEELEAASISTGGFLGLSVFGKQDEIDAWLAEKRLELDGHEVQLKGLAKAFELLHAQRKDLSTALTEFASVTTALADVEPTRRLELVLREFARVHRQLSELYARQKQQDTLFMEATVDEQIRLVTSIRDACNAKQRLQVAASTARADATRRETALDKLYKQNSDKVHQAEVECKHSIDKAIAAEQAYEVASQRVISELQRVEREKIADFRNAAELYLENAVESQKQSIELWETFYSRYFANS